MSNSDYFVLNHKIEQLEYAEKAAQNLEIKTIWASKIEELKEKRMQWLLDKGAELRRRKSE